MIKYLFVFLLGMISAVGVLVWQGVVSTDELIEKTHLLKSRINDIAQGDFFAVTMAPNKPNRFYLAATDDKVIDIEAEEDITFYAFAIDCKKLTQDAKIAKDLLVEQYFGSKASQDRKILSKSVYKFSPAEGSVRLRFLNLSHQDQAITVFYGSDQNKVIGTAKNVLTQLPKDKLKYSRECG